ncbi:MAG: nucleotidyl transferase AbiEii/AbiGii toxin family protein [Actinobacteria bacterium]|nr:nucleotidyl transferase AbiEii/AbiGii toxin family protein [Actinomycetota bacterium]
MDVINDEKLILEREVFTRDAIEKRMLAGGFNSLAKFELFIWDLEMFLQLQRILGDKIILKGGAAIQFYIPITNQRTSIDIDMICLATRDEVHKAINQIEGLFMGQEDYCKFRIYRPKNPKLGLEDLETYFETIPSICSPGELFSTIGKQEVKIEFLFSDESYSINKIRNPQIFALEAHETFNILALENLFADKLTTLGPNTIGIPNDRSDEHFKQIYDIITLFLSNTDQILEKSKLIEENYYKVALSECRIRGILYSQEILLNDMKQFIKRLQQIENTPEMIQRANDFQALYLRSAVNRDKTQWAIVGYQLELIAEYIFRSDKRIFKITDIEEIIKHLKFEHIRGPEKGEISKHFRHELEKAFSGIEGITDNLFRKRIERIIWELVTYVSVEEIKEIVNLK